MSWIVGSCFHELKDILTPPFAFLFLFGLLSEGSYKMSSIQSDFGLFLLLSVFPFTLFVYLSVFPLSKVRVSPNLKCDGTGFFEKRYFSGAQNGPLVRFFKFYKKLTLITFLFFCIKSQ